MRGKVTGFWLVTSITLPVLMAIALPAGAEPEFPGAIQEAAGIPCTPTCLLCHTAIPGTLANLKQPFGLTVLKSGVKPGDASSMNAVVANLRTKMTDTDGDGKLDVDELAIGSDPNKKDANAEICGPTYGCGAHLAPAPPKRAPVMWWLVAALALTALVVARRLRSAE